MFRAAGNSTATATATPTQTATATATPRQTATATATPAVLATGVTWKSYYFARGQRIAMRVVGDPIPANNGVFYLLGDHLGSTNIVVDEDGLEVAELRYKAWAELRYPTSPPAITDYRYREASRSERSERRDTGQREEAAIGLYYYRARWYDPAVGRFAQADTIAPGGGPMAWDRYAYVSDNPLRFSDPSGMKVCEGEAWECRPAPAPPNPGPPDPPTVPPSPEGGDPADPVEVGLEWLTGDGPRHHEFREGDQFAELLQEHYWIQRAKQEIAARIRAMNYSRGSYDYSLAGLQGIPKYVQDYTNILTGGRTGNLAATFLGSYDLDYYVVEVDGKIGTARVLFHVSNESTLSSATHPPLLGYTEVYLGEIGPAIDALVPTGPMSKVTQDFWWTEMVEFR